ncbi:MAG: NAD(P)H-binding protein [Nitrospirota bacterium]|nr:MAG: NAD(P)H-binding protein [Nitrospirota bacterium]
MTIAINTPNGNIGHPLALQLLDAGQKLILLTRSPDKTKSLADRAATVHEGDLLDEAFVVHATKGADVLFWLSPADPRVTDFRGYQDNIAQICIKAVTTNKISHVMTLSSVGAQLTEGTGPILGLGILERMLDKTDSKLTHVRPNYFMENLLQSLDTIAANGMIYLPFPGSIPFDMIATPDIAKACGERLLEENWDKRTIIELAGPKSVSHDSAAATIGKAIGKEVQYIEIDDADFKAAMAKYGVSDSASDVFLEMYDGFKKGTIRHETTPQRTSTTFEWFATNVIKPAIASMR